LIGVQEKCEPRRRNRNPAILASGFRLLISGAA
jgi:hypothetical protein